PAFDEELLGGVLLRVRLGGAGAGCAREHRSDEGGHRARSQWKAPKGSAVAAARAGVLVAGRTEGRGAAAGLAVGAGGGGAGAAVLVAEAASTTGAIGGEGLTGV